MIVRSMRLALGASLVVSLLLSSTAAAAVQYRIDDASMAPLSGPTKIGATVRISKVPLTDGVESDLEVERFEVWAENAEIKVFGVNEEVVATMAPPDAKYYRGRVAGKPDSLVFLSVVGRRLEGLVYADERKFALGSERKGRGQQGMNIVVQESSVLDDVPADGQGFECGVEKTTLNHAVRPHAVTNALGEPVSNIAPTGTQRSVINLAVDTDYELFVKAGSSQANVTTYIGNLLGGVSTIYERDLRTEVRIAYLGIQTNVADPFTVVPTNDGPTTFDALLELGARWHNTPPSANARSAATLISGKSLLSGIAWVGTLCTGDFPSGAGYGGKYSYNGGITPPGSLAVPNPDANPNYVAPSSNYWPLLQVSHELGHNVGSSHTHCIPLTTAQRSEYAVTRSFVDECYSGEAGKGCFGGTQLVPTEKGSIMSYCHLRGPAYATNTRFTFGKDGETSEVALNGLLDDMAGKTPAMSAITAPLSLEIGIPGGASVTNVGGLTYAWKIVNGTFNGGGTTAAGASVSFSGTANPVLLTVTATSSSGCSVTDTKSVTIVEETAVAPAPPTNIVATATGSTSVHITWNASTTADEYDVWRSAGEGSFALVGNAGASTFFTDATAAASTSYRYVVRAATEGQFSTFSDDDVATTVVFTDPILTVDSTKAKAVHFTQLLTAVNAMRTLAGISPISFTAPAPTNAVTIRRQHLLDLRAGLDAARGVVGLSAIGYTDPTITAGSTTVKVVHITQLRDGVR
jgi:hypothetical protein